ncbi:hypothetical protein GW943_02935 [Candidatus Parcubacteria bacterium]|uniref:Nucleoside 2-deoxyribosyltransferase n=1 Tax=Candidatus Kaiserbacteria bacterium CG10_big_fil_rev_8_21_14_0_10_47_16 TaxID=1974608 RepID=A0A2H0UE04_9BACT|nr:hypothetical protein [Candidatus Parcubacteria bacterium]PIR84632.1 MAG: hypothetical protein COU16_03600 [Candidatus Kaiserbacteria bacterium CG10_big_fil_rev_8_21_14_0_10_47_16]
MKLTLCGSIAFYPEFEHARDELVKLGHEVQIPELTKEAPEEFGGGKKVYLAKYIEENGGIDMFPADHHMWGVKTEAIRDHFDKIDWCEGIVVINPEKRGVQGYVGGNTLIEIGVAFYLKKKIYILNDVSSELSYKQEVRAMQPVMLEGDISKVK